MDWFAVVTCGLLFYIAIGVHSIVGYLEGIWERINEHFPEAEVEDDAVD